ncbi:MAG TPA: LptF/LptG family permease [Saprospiraceae bacterium]|nr:LptF/LptG family permease [Saprospiraceae bacterium]
MLTNSFDSLLTIDRYIIRKYLSTFFFTALLFTIISVTIDFSEHIEKFVDQKINTKQILLEYYLNFIPYINGLLWPIFSLIAVIFFTSRLARNTEVVAILNAGMSYRRFLRPYIITALTLAFFYLLGNHIFFPRGNKIKFGFENIYIYPGNLKVKSNNLHLFIGPGVKVFIGNYHKNDSSGTGLRLEQYADLNLVYLLNARTFQYLADTKQWRLKDYDIRRWVDGKEYYTSGRNMQMDTFLSLYPSDFIYYVNEKEMMTSAELLSFIHYEKERGLGASRLMRAEYHRRWAEPFSIVILTVIGASVASRKQRGGMGLHLAIGVGIGSMFVFFSKFALTFSTNLNMPPMLAMWLPNMIFGTLAWYLFKKAQK